MKTVRLLSLFFILIFTACSSDDALVVATENLSGSWNLQRFDTEITTSFNVLGLPVTSRSDAIAEDIDVQITFSENPNTVVSDGSYTLVITTTVLGESQTEEISTTDEILSGTWTLNGNEVTITSTEPDIEQDFQQITYRIIELTETRLRMRANFETTQTIEGSEAELDFTSEIVMTKP